jgi:hypothetical protein
MKVNRLDAVLTRNRKHVVLDIALAAFFLMALLFSGMAFGTELPKLSMNTPATSSPATAQGAAMADAPAQAADHAATLASR